MTALFEFPFLSAALFLIAGILIGHLLWYRDRSADTQKITGLEDRYFKARDSARQRKRQFVQLQKTTESQQTDLQRANQDYHVLEEEKRSLTETLQETNLLLVKTQDERQQVEEILAAEQKRNGSLVAQLQEALQSKADVDRNLQAETSQTSQLRLRQQELETEVEQLRANIDAKTLSADKSLQTIQALQNEVQRRDDSIGALEGDKERLLSEIAKLNDSIKTQAVLTDQSAAASEQAAVQLREEIQKLQDSAKDADGALKQTQQDLVARCEDLDAMRAERDAVKEELAQATARVTELDTELLLAEGAKAERDTLATDLESAATSLAEQRQQLETRDSELAELKHEIHAAQQELSAANHQIAERQSDAETLVASIVQRDAAIEELQARVDELLPLQSQLAETTLLLTKQQEETLQRDDVIRQQQTDLQNLREQVEQKAAAVYQQEMELGKLNDRISALEPLQGELATAAETIDRLQRENEQISVLEEQLRQGKDAYATIHDENELKRSAIEGLNEEIEQLRTQVGELQQTKAELESMSKELVTVSNERDGLSKTRIDLEESIRDLQNQVSSHSAHVKEINELLSVKTQEHSQEVAALNKDIASHSATAEDLRRQLEGKTAQHDQAIDEIVGITKKLDGQQATIEKLTAEMKSLTELRPINHALQDRIAELTGHLRRVSAELEDSLDANSKAQDRIRDLETQLHDHTVKLRDLRRERGSIPGLDKDSGGTDRRAA